MTEDLPNGDSAFPAGDNESCYRKLILSSCNYIVFCTMEMEIIEMKEPHRKSGSYIFKNDVYKKLYYIIQNSIVHNLWIFNFDGCSNVFAFYMLFLPYSYLHKRNCFSYVFYETDSLRNRKERIFLYGIMYLYTIQSKLIVLR